MENLKRRLLNGEEVVLSNENFQSRIGEDDIRMAYLEFRDDVPSWAIGFNILFNGELLHTSKTFKSFDNRLKKLVQKWNLEEVI